MKNPYLVFPFEDAPQYFQDLGVKGHLYEYVVMLPASDASTLVKATAFLGKLIGDDLAAIQSGFAGRQLFDGVMYRIFLI